MDKIEKIENIEKVLNEEGGIYSKIRDGYYLDEEEKAPLMAFAKDVHQSVQSDTCSGDELVVCMEIMHNLAGFENAEDTLESFYQEIVK